MSQRLSCFDWISLRLGLVAPLLLACGSAKPTLPGEAGGAPAISMGATSGAPPVSGGASAGAEQAGVAGTGGERATNDGGSNTAGSQGGTDKGGAAAGAAAGGGPSLFPANGALSFMSHSIAKPGGTQFGQTSLVDIDKDGDRDFVAGAWNGKILWFEYQAADTWVQHEIGGPARATVGGVAFDVDGDGFIDQVSGGDWYKNPGNPRAAPFIKYATGMPGGHDDVAGDIDGDGKLDIVEINNDGMWWFGRGADVTAPWTQHVLAGRASPEVHGGAGVGDIDGDGDIDVTRVDRWFENADGKGENWVTHSGAFDFGQNGPFGVQTRVKLVDFDGDGDTDVIQTEGDILNGRVAWFENVDGKGGNFKEHLIEAPGHQQDFHSLAVADFDLDGDLDIFSCGGPLTVGEKKWFIWQNMDGKGQTLARKQVFAGPECHEAVAADVDGDGDIDICTKPWEGGDEHLYLENLLIP